MARRRREEERRRLLPGSVESGLRRMMLGLYGLVLIAAAGAAWASLATWSVHDPSFNNATQAEPRNVLGWWGAVLADLSIQSLGLASIVLFLPIAAWGWHMIFRTGPERRRARLFIWPVAVLMLAAALSALPQPRSWPLPNGLGGILGDFFMAGAHVVGVLPAAAVYFVAGLVFLSIGTSLLLFTCGTSFSALIALWAPRTRIPSEWANASLGAAMHIAMHTKARVKRGFFWQRRKADPDEEMEPDETELPVSRGVALPAPDADGRIEPSFGFAPVAADGEEDYEDDADFEEEATRAKNIASPGPPAKRRRGIRVFAASGASTHTRHRRSSSCSRRRAARAPRASATRCSRRTHASSRACWPISASRARSPMYTPVPWSRFMSSSQRQAPNPRASSGLPTTSPAP